jgi:rhombotail lipoprotein
MKRSGFGFSLSLLRSLPLVLLIAGCATGSTKHTTSAVNFLYPDKKIPVVTRGIPVLNLPLSVGIAFVPGEGGGHYGKGLLNTTGLQDSENFRFTEKKKKELMQEVADHFKQYSFIQEIKIVSSSYLKPGGSFANLERVRSVYGVDVIALMSFDQTQFTDEGFASLAYWTLIGILVVPGEKNDTHTMVDTVVYDIQSRKLLFRAPGLSNIKGNSTPGYLRKNLRANSDKGIEVAAKDMIINLDAQLALFREKVKENPDEFKVVEQPKITP